MPMMVRQGKLENSIRVCCLPGWMVGQVYVFGGGWENIQELYVGHVKSEVTTPTSRYLVGS